MANIRAVMTRQDGESIADFKERCGRALFELDPGPGSFAMGRFTIGLNGWLKNDTAWGQGWLDELPSETCVIAAYSAPNRSGVLAYTEEELSAAPRNPGMPNSIVDRDLGPRHGLHVERSDAADQTADSSGPTP